MALAAGTLTLTLEYASGLKDKDFFGKQDPYAIVQCGGQKFRSKTATDGGKNPVWNQQFQFNIINENDVTVTLFDEDVSSTDDMIGRSQISLATVRMRNSDRQQAQVITKSGKSHGTLNVSLAFAPNQAGAGPYGGGHASAPPAPYPGAPYAAPGMPPPSGYPPQGHGPPAPYPAPYGAPPPSGYPAPMPGGPPPAGYPPMGAPPPAQPSAYPPTAGYPPPGQYPPQPGYPPAGYPPPAAHGPPAAAYGHAPTAYAVGGAAAGYAAAHMIHGAMPHGSYPHKYKKKKYKGKHKGGFFGKKWKMGKRWK